jgi:hypothetical protein
MISWAGLQNWESCFIHDSGASEPLEKLSQRMVNDRPTTHATRPLRLLEVAEMIKVTHTPLGTSSLKKIKNIVRAACGPLLQILHGGL